MKCYKYLVKASSEDEQHVFDNVRTLVEYLNHRINLDVYTPDIIHNYFIRTGRKVNPLISGLYHLSRHRAYKAG